MCPHCKSTQWLTKSEDPDYWNCMYCGPNPKPDISRLPYVLHARMPKSTNSAYQISTCADCGAEIEARSKRCKKCAGKGARV